MKMVQRLTVSLQRGVLKMMNFKIFFVRVHIGHLITNENLLKSLEQSPGSFQCKEDSKFHVATDCRINYRNSHFVMPCCSQVNSNKRYKTGTLHVQKGQGERESIINWNIWTGKLYKWDQFNGIPPDAFNQLYNTCYFNTFLKFLLNVTCFSHQLYV
jgi:hypothetical protein